ncbi:hypothetical protein KPL70_005350 [Citrus sinensis]|nr:hypothetical protein KPL70_005350 [Citrus sinensis]
MQQLALNPQQVAKIASPPMCVIPKDLQLFTRRSCLCGTAAGAACLWWCSEALRGVSNIGRKKNTPLGSCFYQLVPGATSFPMVIVTTASFNESLWKRIGRIGKNTGDRRQLARILSLWADMLLTLLEVYKMLTDKKMLRNFERTRPLKVSACCKHYTAYDVENWQSVDRLSFDARVPEQDMAETLQVPFETCDKEGYFCSVIYIVSDSDSIEVIFDNQKFPNDTKEDAAAQTPKVWIWIVATTTPISLSLIIEVPLYFVNEARLV